MDIVTVSPKFQVVIPQRVRKALKLKVGQKVQVLIYQNRIEIIPFRPLSEMCGFVEGIDTTIEREEDREL